MSQYYAILQAVRDVLASAGGFSGVTFAIRKVPFFSPDHGDTLPFCCVAPEREGVGELYMGGKIQDYPVLVAVYQERGTAAGDQGPLAGQLDLRAAAEAALYAAYPLPAVPTCFDCHAYDPEAAFPEAGLSQAVDCTVQRFTFRNDEPA